jgi:hypothetical protein
MLTNYTDQILTLLILAVILNFYLAYKLVKKDELLEKTISQSLRFNKGEGTARGVNSEILTITKLNTGNIRTLTKQMDQVQWWLSQLNISNLILAKEGEPDSVSVMEELQQRVEWIKELEQRQTNEADFYKGD